MIGIVSLAFASLATFACLSRYRAFRKHLADARHSGLPYFVSPVHLSDIWWLVTQNLLLPCLLWLPREWTRRWLPMSMVWKIWRVGHDPFADANTDTFLLVSPSGNMLWTCDPEVCDQIYSQHSKFQAPVEMLGFYDIYGPTIGSTEGDEWRFYRKISTPSFNPATNEAAWREALHQAEAMTTFLSQSGSTIHNIGEHTTRLSLHVITRVFFGKALEWNAYNGGREAVTPGHAMGFGDAIFSVLQMLGIIFATPRLVLARSPLPGHKKAFAAFEEWTRYMEEMRDETVAQLDIVRRKENRSLLESLVMAGDPESVNPGGRMLSPNGVLGNIFFYMLAGHETAGNTLAFTILLLALYPEYQRNLQQELDKQLGDRLALHWSIDQDFQLLFKGYLGAVLKESLRLFCVVQFVPKKAQMDTGISTSDGKGGTVPANTLCLINFAATHRNPKYWPTGRAEPSQNARLPALDFDPFRWLNEDGDVVESAAANPKAYFPFGFGHRSCPGKRFAQIEISAALAQIFKQYSVELVPDEADIRSAQVGENSETWLREQTRAKAVKSLYENVGCNITVHMLKDLPVRLVKRRDEG